jgi:tetratricopeptide (TPR) repeat protein
VHLRETLRERHPEDNVAREQLLSALRNYADSLRKVKRFDDGIATAERATALARAWYEESPEDLSVGLTLIWSLQALSDQKIPLDDLTLGLADARSAVEIGRTLEQKNPNDPRLLRTMAWALFRYGIWVENATRDVDAALALQEEAMDYRRRVIAARPGDPNPVAELLSMVWREHFNLIKLGRHEEAAERLTDYRQLAIPTVDARPMDMYLLEQFAQVTLKLCDDWCARGEIDTAIAAIEDLCERVARVPDDHPDYHVVQKNTIDGLMRVAEMILPHVPEKALEYANQAAALAPTPRDDIAAMQTKAKAAINDRAD